MPMPGGATVAENSSNRHFYHQDWLGSARFVSDMFSRGPFIDRAFAPFGEIYANVRDAGVDPDFTGDFQDDFTAPTTLQIAS
jgi:hypothetical protein